MPSMRLKRELTPEREERTWEEQERQVGLLFKGFWVEKNWKKEFHSQGKYFQAGAGEST